jgi:anti-anti-sigma regulatory factor
MDCVYEGAPRLQLVSEYDLAVKDSVAALFGTLPPDRAVVIDMTEVMYMDSTFLHQIDALRLGA